MLRFFKRSAAKTVTAPAESVPPQDSEPTTPADLEPAKPVVRVPANDTDERRRFPRPLPLPEVVEGNGDTDWSLWEESVSLQKAKK
jgi:hypothetical protein